MKNLTGLTIFSYSILPELNISNNFLVDLRTSPIDDVAALNDKHICKTISFIRYLIRMGRLRKPKVSTVIHHKLVVSVHHNEDLCVNRRQP